MLFVLFGLAVGTVGSLVGIGGGFIIVPVLLSIMPELGHTKIAAISMVAVAFNSSSGSVAYFLRKLVHVKAALAFSLAGLPGAVLGVYFERFVSQESFGLIFGGILMAYSIYLLTRSKVLSSAAGVSHRETMGRSFYVKGSLISFFVGFFASFLGIGGGMFYMPMLTSFGFLVQMAAGTSQLILAITSWVATSQHFLHGHIHFTEPILLQIGLGVIVGAQLGSSLSKKVSGSFILKLLAVGLFFVGARLLWAHL